MSSLRALTLKVPRERRGRARIIEQILEPRVCAVRSRENLASTNHKLASSRRSAGDPV
jgi:hypothetical protein